MTMKDTLRKQRRGALVVLGVVALAVIATVALASEYSEHWGTGDRTALNQPLELRGVWLGMRLASAGSTTARELGVPDNVKGVVVAEISRGPDSRASSAGILPGDVVVQVDGRDVESLEELQSLSTRLDVARPLTMQILRQGLPFTLMLPPPADMGLQPGAVTPVGFQGPGAGYGAGYGAANAQAQGYPMARGPNCPLPGWRAR